METTERIVESYVRCIKGWATIPNVHCKGQHEIDLIAIDPVSLDRYHIETSVSISQGFRNLTNKPFDREKAKQRVHQAGQRRTLGFFINKKFGSQGVLDRLSEFGFEQGRYSRVVVTWGWDEGVLEAAGREGIILWSFREIIQEIAEEIRGSRQYFSDDTLRTLNLFIHAEEKVSKKKSPSVGAPARQMSSMTEVAISERFWVYENWTNECATVHQASCPHCNDGRGVHGKSSAKNGIWHGPFATAPEAWSKAKQTGRDEIRACGKCSPQKSE